MDKIAILDFGGQYCHLIARRIRDFGVYAEVMPSDLSHKAIEKDEEIKGIILSGGSRSVYEKNPPRFDKAMLTLGLPILGICYGHQLIAHVLKGKVELGKSGEYGLTELDAISKEGILQGVPSKSIIWMNHADIVTELPREFSILAKTKGSPIAVFSNEKKHIFGVQFHPEVSHTQKGTRILKNFVLGLCRCKRAWSTRSLIQDSIAEAKQTIGNKKAIIGLSGGIDSSVAAVLVNKAIGRNLTAVYVDTGFMREGETGEIRKLFYGKSLNIKIIHAKEEFLNALRGVISPEQKRKIIGRLFASVFSREAKKQKAFFLIQGTIYSDRIESGITKLSSIIKSHHNVGGLPKDLALRVYEPLRNVYKDEVRSIAKKLGLPKEILSRQVFPGPGLAIRIIGEVTEKRVAIVRKAGSIIEEELRKTPFWKDIWMSFAVLLPIKSVGIQGDKRSYKYPVALRIVESKDAMTANVSRIPFEVLEKISTRITNEVKEVNRVVYDITNKPPATMEWE